MMPFWSCLSAFSSYNPLYVGVPQESDKYLQTRLYTHTVWARDSHVTTNGQLILSIWYRQVPQSTTLISNSPYPKPSGIPYLGDLTTTQLVTQPRNLEIIVSFTGNTTNLLTKYYSNLSPPFHYPHQLMSVLF